MNQFESIINKDVSVKTKIKINISIKHNETT